MNSSAVLALLETNKNERGIQKWEELYPGKDGLKSFGIGLTVLRKLAKQIGRDHDLALELWEYDIYDVKIIALLIDDPKRIDRDQAEAQVEQLNQGYLAHVFSSCDAALAKTSFVVELASDWMSSKDPIRRRCGYGLLYELSKSKKKSAPADSFFLKWIHHIQNTYVDEKSPVRLSMGGALVGMGKRNAKLNAAALEVAELMGPIHFGRPEQKCEPFDMLKHLTSDYLKKKFSA